MKIKTLFFASTIVLLGQLALSQALFANEADDPPELKLRALEEGLNRFKVEGHYTTNELGDGLKRALSPLDGVTASAPLREQGVVQEIYLTFLTKLIRGVEFAEGETIFEGKQEIKDVTGWDLAMRNPHARNGPRSGLEVFRDTFPQIQLDKKGLSLLKEFVISYEGIERNDIVLALQKISNLIKEKTPVDFAYSDYPYTSVYEEGSPSFVYKRFKYFILKIAAKGRRTPPSQIQTKNRYPLANSSNRGLTVGQKARHLSVNQIAQEKIKKLEQLLSSGEYEKRISRFTLESIEEEGFGELFLQKLEDIPPDHPMRRQGIIQEFYLDMLTRLIRGGPQGKLLEMMMQDGTTQYNFSTDPDFVDNLSELEQKLLKNAQAWTLKNTYAKEDFGGVAYFKSFLNDAPLDSRGIALLRGFLLAYEGVEEVEIFEDLVREVENKRPVDFHYTDFKYRAVFREGKTCFGHFGFNYDIKRKGVIDAITAQVKRVRNFVPTMRKYIIGDDKHILRAGELIKENMVNPKKLINIVLTGPSGNGKSEFARAMAISLHGTTDALLRVAFTGATGEANNFLRSAAGYVGSDLVTEFEERLKDRIKKGQGGIIHLEELLSFAKLTEQQLAEKSLTFNRLYTTLDERVIHIGGQSYDISKFHIVMSGNLFQELAAGLDGLPNGEKIVARRFARLSKQDAVNILLKKGFDPPKVGRLGEFFFMRPLFSEESLQVGKKFLKANMEALANYTSKNVEVVLSPKILKGIIKRLVTFQLGMRQVAEGISQVIMSPINGIVFDLPNVQKIEGKLTRNKVQWYVNGKEVVYAGKVPNKESPPAWKFVSNLVGKKFENRTPGFDRLNTPRKIKNSKLEAYITGLHEHKKGHWMVSTLLHGKNMAESISILPGELDSGTKFAGIVLQKNQGDVLRTVSLSTILKKNIELEAGHRGPILEGFRSTGGGSAFRQEIPDDDLGKVYINIKMIVANELIPGVRELAGEEDRLIFQQVIKDLGQEAANEVISFGSFHGFADDSFELLMKRGQLNEKELDRHAKNALKRLNIDHDIIFVGALERSIQNLLKKYREKSLPRRNFAKRVEILQSLFEATTQDVLAIRGFEQVDPVIANNIRQRASSAKIAFKNARWGKGCVARMKTLLLLAISR